MLNYLFIAILGLLGGWMFKWIIEREWYQKLILTFGAAADVALDRHLDDEDKERQLKKYFLGLGGKLFMAVLMTVLALTPLLIVLYGPSDIEPLRNTMLQPWGLILLTLMSVLPFFFLKKTKSAYSRGAQLLHHLWLDNPNMSWMLFRIERKRLKKEGERPPVFIVTGLARAGTTALLYTIKDLGFQSLTYRQMPYLLSPKILGGLNRKKAKNKARSHGDGLEISLDKAEALEEFFWQANLGVEYAEKEALGIQELNEDQMQAYEDYVRLIAADKGPYIAKNNNFILRYQSLKEQMKDLRVLWVFRSPIDHAYSLYKQHHNYLEQQDEDPFILSYMNWLGHQEFGNGHIPFRLSADSNPYTMDDPNYWLFLWKEYYQFALQFKKDELILWIDHAQLANHPLQVVQEIGDLASLKHDGIKAVPYQDRGKSTPDVNWDADLLKRCQQIYHDLAKVQ